MYKQMSNNIDDEWNKYLSLQNKGSFCYSGLQPSVNQTKIKTPPSTTLNSTITQNSTRTNNDIPTVTIEPIINKLNIIDKLPDDIPICDELYISTKTKVLFLNQPIDIYNIFWNIPIVEYGTPQEGIVKKQMKIVSNTPEEYERYRQKLVDIPYYNEHIIKQIDNQTARRTKYKDERKITVGLSKKDIMNCRGKVKNAFYNCFAIILRFQIKNIYREIHVKIFNTGKLEIPGILNDDIFDIVKRMIISLIQPNVSSKVDFIETDSENNVLINSNFNCGYYINREILHSILRGGKYRIESAYDPCSYPGVKCKFYFNNEKGFDANLQNGQILEEDRSLKMSELGDNLKYTEISFMIFRTGSCLIVGNCTERILKFVFEFIKKLLADEYSKISVNNTEPVNKNKKVKLRKKTIMITNAYFNDTIISASQIQNHSTPYGNYGV